MSEGWKCPVCGRGVAPSEKTCEHGALDLRSPNWFRQFPILREPTTGDQIPRNPWYTVSSADIPVTDTALGDVGMIKRAGLGAGHGG